MRKQWVFGGLLALASSVAKGAPCTQHKSDHQARVACLLRSMTLDEKIGQMVQVSRLAVDPQLDDIAALGLGSILSGGGAAPSVNNAESWRAMVESYQRRALSSRLQIPLLYGVDAVHGHSNVRGATIFPHNVGLGAADNGELMRAIGRITALEVAKTGIHWNFSPAVPVTQDIRWGRTYESFGEDPKLVERLAHPYLLGLQQGFAVAEFPPIMGTAKHFVGDGGTIWGSSTSENYVIDRGVTAGDEVTLRSLHLRPYLPLFEAGVKSVMVSYSSFGGQKMHGHRALITETLKGEFGFDGIVISDWAGIDELPGSRDEQVAAGVNAGVDMFMLPAGHREFIESAKRVVSAGQVPIARIDDAVTRILKTKLELGLFDAPFGRNVNLPEIGNAEHRAVARQAVRESLVLLKNDKGVLPLPRDAGRILVAGLAADDIGLQCGGWTISWQGQAGAVTPGTTLLGAMREETAGKGVDIVYAPTLEAFAGQASKQSRANYGIVVLAERPYAEGVGDDGELRLADDDVALVNAIRSHVDQLVLVVYSGRPLMLESTLATSDALVAAWLPGTEGRGLTDVLFGSAPFRGKLPFTWPRSMAGYQGLPVAPQNVLFPYGFGLSTAERSVSGTPNR